MGRKSSTGGGGGRAKRAAGEELSADMFDEIETFHRSKDKLSLAVESDEERSEEGSDAEADEGVYDLSDEDDDDEGLSDDDEEADGMMGKLAKQAKLLGQKLKVDAGNDESDEEEDQADEADVKWGRKKRDYYNADTLEYELTDDEDAVQEEEEEATRLQKEAAEQLRPEDYGEEDSSDAESSQGEDGEETMADRASKAAGSKGAQVERIARDPSALTDAERISAVTANAPELLALLGELQTYLAEIRQRVGPLLEEVRSGGIGTKEGVSFLEAKNLLLLNYCMCIVFYCLLKAEGRSVKDHPVILRLVQLRAYLDKLRPIEKKLTYQMEKLLSLARSGRLAGAGPAGPTDEDDLLQYRPRPGKLAEKGGAGPASQLEDAKRDGIYRPPRMNPVAMDDDPDVRSKRRQAERKSKEALRKASRSETVRELMAEMDGLPTEIRSSGTSGMDTKEALRTRQKMEAREEMEENMFARVSLTKDERKKLRAQQRAGLSGKAIMDDFADEVADLVDSAAFDTGRVAQKFGADLHNATGKRGTATGDADVPLKESLTDRRAKMDSKRARQSAAAEAEEMMNEIKKSAKRARQSTDETYLEAKSKGAAKKDERKGKYAFPELQPAVGDEDTQDMRGITREIEKNRGLTPHRSKDKKNPRKKHRLGYEKAQVRRKGQVQDVKKPTSGYGGEETGIKSRVAKSRKL